MQREMRERKKEVVFALVEEPLGKSLLGAAAGKEYLQAT